MNTKYRIITSIVAVVVLVGLYLVFSDKGEGEPTSDQTTFQIK